MLGGLLKKLPGAMRDGFDKMKGSMLLSMAKGMAPADAEMMARHWGYLQEAPTKAEEVGKKISGTAIPQVTIAVETILQSIPAKSNNEPEVVVKTAVKAVEMPVTTVIPVVPIVAQVVTAAAPVAAEVIPPVSDVVPVIAALVAPAPAVAPVPEVKDEVNVVEVIHPIFGKKIVDLGYKTVYLTSVALLARTQVWERQRTLRPERAARIAASKVALGRTKSLSGVITMFCDKETGLSGIVDGQHRAGALMMLSQQGHWEGHEKNILIDVFETKSDEEVVALFKEINSAEPVRLVDMPGEGASDVVKDILNSTIEQLCEEFPDMFKPSLRCKPPHLHESILRDDIFQSDLITRRGLKSSTDLKELIAQANENYSKKSDSEWEKTLLETKMFKSSGKALGDAVKKARQSKFFLGLDNSWMHAP